MQYHRFAVSARANQEKLLSVFDSLDNLPNFFLPINDLLPHQFFSEAKWIFCHVPSPSFITKWFITN
jgi:hypothetical protein